MRHKAVLAQPRLAQPRSGVRGRPALSSTVCRPLNLAAGHGGCPRGILESRDSVPLAGCVTSTAATAQNEFRPWQTTELCCLQPAGQGWGKGPMGRNPTEPPGTRETPPCTGAPCSLPLMASLGPILAISILPVCVPRCLPCLCPGLERAAAQQLLGSVQSAGGPCGVNAS